MSDLLEPGAFQPLPDHQFTNKELQVIGEFSKAGASFADQAVWNIMHNDRTGWGDGIEDTPESELVLKQSNPTSYDSISHAFDPTMDLLNFDGLLG